MTLFGTAPETTDIRTAFHILDSMADLVSVLNDEGRFVYANQALIRQIGHNPIGTYFDDASNFMLGFSSVPTVRHTKTAVVKEERIGEQYFSVTTSPVFDDNHKISAFVEVYHDISAKINLTIDLVNTNRKMTDDIQFARTIQKKILPERLDYGEVQFEARYTPSERLSGDLYDIIALDDRHIAFYISDVMGHGVTASMMTMFVRQTMRSLVTAEAEPADVLENLRSHFCELDLGDSNYFTLFYGLYDKYSRVLVYSNAGHTAIPIVFEGEETRFLRAKGVPISPVFRDIRYNTRKETLKQGESLLLYTDGITETTNLAGEEFGEERLRELLSSIEGDVLQQVIRVVNRYRWGEMKDDIALMLMRVL